MNIFARVTNGGWELGLQNQLCHIWWSALLCALQNEISGIVDYKYFNILIIDIELQSK